VVGGKKCDAFAWINKLSYFYVMNNWNFFKKSIIYYLVYSITQCNYLNTDDENENENEKWKEEEEKRVKNEK